MIIGLPAIGTLVKQIRGHEEVDNGNWYYVNKGTVGKVIDHAGDRVVVAYENLPRTIESLGNLELIGD